MVDSAKPSSGCAPVTSGSECARIENVTPPPQAVGILSYPHWMLHPPPSVPVSEGFAGCRVKERKMEDMLRRGSPVNSGKKLPKILPVKPACAMRIKLEGDYPLGRMTDRGVPKATCYAQGWQGEHVCKGSPITSATDLYECAPTQKRALQKGSPGGACWMSVTPDRRQEAGGAWSAG